MQDITLKQQKNLPSEAVLNRSQNIVIVVPEARWPQFPYQNVLKKRQQRLTDPGRILVTDLPNDIGSHISLARVKTGLGTFDCLELARNLITPHLDSNPAALTIVIAGCQSSLTQALAEALVAALLAACAELPSYKSAPRPKRRLRQIVCYGIDQQIDYFRLQATAAGNNLARQLTMLPPNELTPKAYLQRLRPLARQHGWTLTFLDRKTLRRKKAGAFLAVCQGSPNEDAGIVHLRYRPRQKRSKARLALVGKGICFDTGGVNLKTAKYMHGMHEDMQGSAVALGTLLALSLEEVPFQVDCWLALAENHIGPSAYKQNDIVTASNGTTIEVMHTDAEGRMVLADTLAIAARQKPDFIIDYATLTGSCIYALGTRYSGVFTNQDDLLQTLIDTGRTSGERCWPFPIDDDYDKGLVSDIADVKQCSLDGEADHILAARFLQRFVNDTPWLHVDLAAGNHKGGLAHIASDITGFGVRYSVELLQQGRLFKQLSRPRSAGA